MAIILLLGVALIGIPLTVYLGQRQQETRSRAAVTPEDGVVVVIDGIEYTKAQVRKIAEEYNDPSVVDTQSLNVALQILEERKILDKAQKDLGIQVDSSKLNTLVQAGFSQEDARYEVLKDQVILKVVRSRRAISIRFWNPPSSSLSSLTAEERTAAANELRDGTAALGEAETRLRAGEDIFEIADSLLVKYPSLVPVLGVNGYILSGMDELEKLEAKLPPTYEIGDSNLDKETLDTLFAMQVNEVSSVINTEANRGGTVFKLLTIGNNNGLGSYEIWLSGQIASLVKIVNPL